MNANKVLILSCLLLGAGIFSSCNKTTTVQPAATVNTHPAITSGDEDDTPKKATLSYMQNTSPVIFEMTSTGCPGCGGWGKPTFAKLVQSYTNKVTPVAVHIKYGDPMITTESTAIWDNIEGSRYTPMIFVQGENAVIINGSSISSESENNARRLIDEALMTTQPSLSANIVKKEGKWDITYGVKFDGIPSGAYSLSCYLTEDGIKHQQSNYAGNPATHNHVIRASANGAFGTGISSTDLTNGEWSMVNRMEIDNTYNMENLYVTVVLWKKTGERYAAVNGYVLK